MDAEKVQLFTRYINGQCSTEELDHVFQMLSAGSHSGEWEAALSQDAEFLARTDQQGALTSAAIEEIYNHISASISSPSAKNPDESRRVRLWPTILSAAAAIALIISGLWFFNTPQADKQQQNPGLSGQIAPGGQGATLTLSNGTKVVLAEAGSGQLASQGGVIVSKSAEGELVYTVTGDLASGQSGKNTLSTARGQTYQVRLPDGSQVWLNADSRLTYPVNFAKNGSREVSLSGEAYFQVAKDKARPFLVSSKNQQVEVLGTHFNINSYEDEPHVTTTLLEGSVRVLATMPKNKGPVRDVLLRPGSQAVNSGSQITVSAVDLESVTDWKDGDFYLNHVEFKTAMRKIARWYDVDIVYDSSVPDDLETGGWISRNNQLSAVLKLIASSGQVRFQVKDKTIYVSR
ncbi:FecR family protein [Pedobacter deserti]|uniref:FecR family protein n=1 Tax=Pedobacter deserti TaxID=2817382 RepID=UPI00210A4C05|nr:FecR domain-containing protein [Pedobacter sp. SYSU D00382]